MNISLIHLLKTGCLGEIRLGLAADDIQVLLGSPDAAAKSCRKHRYPDIWLYGGVELWFDQSEPQACRNIWIERIGFDRQDGFKMPAGSVVEDWNLQPYQPRDAVEAYLQQNDIHAFQPEPMPVGKKGYIFAPRHLVVPASNVTLGFDEDWRLNSLLAGYLT